MPIYEYQCAQCGHITELTHGISASPSLKCPTCKKKMKKIISLNSFQLKGSGWYKTDYPKSGATATASTKKSGESASPVSTESPKSDTAVAKKSGEKASSSSAE